MARQGSVIIMDGGGGPVRQGSLVVYPQLNEAPARGGSGKGASPSDTVADLDGSSSPGVSGEYSRGDHKHDDPARTPSGGTEGQVLAKITGSDFDMEWRDLILFGTSDPPSSAGLRKGTIYLKIPTP